MVTKLDAFIALMRDPEAGFIIQESSRKRKFTESSEGGWDNGDRDQRAKYNRDVKGRVEGYTEGESSCRSINRANGLGRATSA